MNEITLKTSDKQEDFQLNTTNYPNDLWHRIYSVLLESLEDSFPELPKNFMSLRGANKHVYTICLSPLQWKAFLKKYFPSALAHPFPNMKYSILYRKHALKFNYLKNNNTPSYTFLSDQNISSYQLQGNFLCVDSRNVRRLYMDSSPAGTATVWNLCSGEKHSIFQNQRQTSRSGLSQVHDDLLFIDSENGTALESWDIRTGERKHIFNGISSDFIVHKNFLLSFSPINSDVIIWDFLTGNQLKSLPAPESYDDRGLLAHDGLLFMGTYGCIECWDIQKGQLIRKFEQKTNQDFYSIVKICGNFIIACSSQKISIWDIKTGDLVHEILCKGAICSLQVKDGLVFASSYTDGKINAYDIRTGKQIGMFDSGDHPMVSSLEISGDYLFGLRNSNPNVIDSQIFIWHIPTLKKIQTFVCKFHVNFLQVYRDQLFAGPHREGVHQSPGSKELTVWSLSATPFAFSEDALLRNSKILKETAQPPISNSMIVEDFVGFQGVLPLQSLENSFLAQLGIVTKEEYSKKLECSPEFLSQVGVCSEADLEILGVKCLPISFLEMLLLPEVDPRDRRELETQCFAKREKITDCLDKMFKEADINRQNRIYIKEFGKKNPWGDFQTKIGQFLEGMKDRCGSQKKLIAFFEAESYAGAIHDVNALIDEFNLLNQNHQVEKLHSYLLQWGLLNAWRNLQERKGIATLTDLLAMRGSLSEDELFQMGK